jgi:hypothetical protein
LKIITNPQKNQDITQAQGITAVGEHTALHQSTGPDLLTFAAAPDIIIADGGIA